MTYPSDFILPTEIVEQITSQGLDYIPELVRILVNAAMRAEWENYLGAGLYQRSNDRQGHANGYKPKTVQTRVGDITFAIPQVREGGFFSQALEKGQRSERALTLTLAEMYVQGVSTHKVKAIVEQLFGKALSIWKAQNGYCLQCAHLIDLETDWDIHHIAWRSMGGGDHLSNLQMLHPICHRQIHCR